MWGMPWLSNKWVWLFLSVVILVLPCPCQSQTPVNFGARMLSILDHNLGQDLPDQNIALRDEIMGNDSFQLLNCYEQGQLVHKLGVSFYLTDQEVKAIDLFHRVVYDYWHNCPDVLNHERANSMYNIGVCYQYTPEKYKAQSYIDSAIFLLEKDSSYSRQALAEKYLGAGSYYSDLRDHEKARNYLAQAYQLFGQEEEYAYEKFTVLNLLLILHLEFKEYEHVIQIFREAKSQYAIAYGNLESVDLALIYLNVAIAFFETGEYALAQKHCQRGLNLVSFEKHADIYSNGIETMAMISKSQGHYLEAERHFKRVLELRNSDLPNLRHSALSRSVALENLGELYFQQGRERLALKYLNEALRTLCGYLIFNRNHLPILANKYLAHPVALVRQLSIRANILLDEDASINLSDQRAEAAVYHKIDTILSRSMQAFLEDISRLEYLDLVADYYGQAIMSWLRIYHQSRSSADLEKVHYFSCRSKSAILQQHLFDRQLRHDVLSSEEIAWESAVHKDLAELANSLEYAGGLRDSLRGLFLRKQLEFDLIHDELRNKYSDQLPYDFPQPPSLNALQEKLFHNEALVEYIFAGTDLVQIWITRKTVNLVTFEVDSSFNDALRRLRKSLQDPSLEDDSKVSHYLFQKLMEEGLKSIPAEVKRICILADGKLHGVPFEILQMHEDGNDAYLLEDYTIAYSLSPALAFRDRTSHGRTPMVAFGTNYSGQLSQMLREKQVLSDADHLPSLNLAEEEARKACQILEGRFYVGKEAKLDQFFHSAADAEILYLSLHGLVDYHDSHRSCIVFDDRTSDFLLTPTSLHAHQLDANLVILSSCHSADGKVYRGEGISGMTRSFLYAGAQTVISSLWTASERTAMEMLQSTLRNYKKLDDPVQALRKAKIDYIKTAPPSLQHPFYWANFVVMGRTLTVHKGPQYFYALVVSLLTVLVGIILTIKKYQKRS